MPKKPKPQGNCALTGLKGPFVKSHIVPQAFTLPESKGAPLVTFGESGRPHRRWTSWYDQNLCTADGEAILAKYDSKAINFLRHHKLVWSGWGPMCKLNVGEFEEVPNTPNGVRRLSNVDTTELRLFFLSILWRAAASKLRSCTEIEIAPAALNQLRDMVRDGIATPRNVFPISLTQLSTIGHIHNQSPLAMTKLEPNLEGGEPTKVPFFRFYFDGLVAHFDRRALSEEFCAELGPLLVGNEDNLVLSTVTAEHSSQLANLKNVLRTAHAEWPEEIEKLMPTERLRSKGILS